jgi:hypothetical protein
MTASAERRPSRSILLGYVQTKSLKKSQTRNLYDDPLWRERKGYAETSGSSWSILSARLGLALTPESS